MKPVPAAIRIPYDLLLFVSACIFLFVLPVIEDVPEWVLRLCMSLVFIFSALSLEQKHYSLLIPGFIVIALDWFVNLGQESLLNQFLRPLTFLFIVWVVISLMRNFLTLNKVGISGLLAAVNGYLLLGILFTGMVVMMQNLNPGAFTKQEGAMTSSDLIYYTIITLSTTGYGDILPASAGAKNLSMIIAVAGQMYVAFLVGVLVSKYSSQSE